VLRGKTVLQQPVDIETWKPEEGGGGALELMTLCHKDLGVHGFCVAIEGGTWLVQECEVGAVLCGCADGRRASCRSPWALASWCAPVASQRVRVGRR